MCFSTNYPQLFGSESGGGDTAFYALDVDSAYQVLVGGATNSTAIANLSTTPVVALYDTSQTIAWSKQFSGGYDYVSDLLFFDSIKAIVILQSWAQSLTIGLCTLSLSTGALLANTYDNSGNHYIFSTFNSILLGPSSNQFYFIFKDYYKYFYINRYTVTSNSITIDKQASYNIDVQPTALVNTEDSLFVASYYSSGQGLTSVSYSTMAHQYHLRTGFGGPTFYIRKMSYYNDGSDQYIFACLSSSTQDVIRFKVTNSAATGNVTATHISNVNDRICYDIQGLAQDQSIVMAHSSASNMFALISNFTNLITTQYHLIYLSYSNNLMRDAKIISKDLIYFCGYVGKMDGTLSTNTYGYTQGFISKFEPTDLGVLKPIKGSVTMTTVSPNWNVYSYAQSNGGHSNSAFTLSVSGLLTDPKRDISSYYLVTKTIVFSPPTPVTNYQYTIYDPSYSFTIPTYLVTNCVDVNYTNSYTSSPALPSSVTFDTNFTFTVQSNVVSDAKVYTITFTQQVQDGQKSSQTFTLTLIDPCLSSIYTPSTVADQIYQFDYTSSPLTITIPVFTSSNTVAQCGSFVYSATDENGAALDSSFLTFNADARQLTIQSNGYTKVNKVYKIVVYGYQGTYSAIKRSLTFSVTVSSTCSTTTITTQQISNQTYLLKETMLEIPLVPWTDSLGVCGPITYQIQIDGIISNSNGYITFDTVLQEFQIYSSSSNSIGTHEIVVYGSIWGASATNSMTFQVRIEPNNQAPPYFVDGLQTSLTLTVPDTQTIILSEIKDIDGDGYSISLSAGQASSFIVFKEPNLKVSAMPSKTGTYTVKITLTDDNPVPLSITYDITITINPKPQEQQLEEVVPQAFKSTKNGFLVFGDKLIDTSKLKKLNATIVTVSMEGIVDIKFSEKMLEYNKWWEIYFYKALALSYIPDSSNVDYDDLQICFNVTQFFITYNLDKMIDKNYCMKHSIPPQLPNNSILSMIKIIAATKMLQQFGDSASSSMGATMVVNLILAIVLGFSLKQLWMLMNTLQILTHLPLLSISIPSNAVFLAQSLKDISNMNVIPKEVLNKITGLFSSSDDSNVKDGKFQNMDIF